MAKQHKKQKGLLRRRTYMIRLVENKQSTTPWASSFKSLWWLRFSGTCWMQNTTATVSNGLIGITDKQKGLSRRRTCMIQLVENKQSTTREQANSSSYANFASPIPVEWKTQQLLWELAWSASQQTQKFRRTRGLTRFVKSRNKQSTQRLPAFEITVAFSSSVYITCQMHGESTQVRNASYTPRKTKQDHRAGWRTRLGLTANNHPNDHFLHSKLLYLLAVASTLPVTCMAKVHRRETLRTRHGKHKRSVAPEDLQDSARRHKINQPTRFPQSIFP